MSQGKKVDPVLTLRVIRDSITPKPAVSFEGMYADQVVFQDRVDHVQFRLYQPPDIDCIAISDRLGIEAARRLAAQLIADFRQVTTSELRLFLLHIAALAKASENRSLLTGYRTALEEYYTSPTLFVFALQRAEWIGPPRAFGAAVLGKLGDEIETEFRSLAEREAIAGRFGFDSNQPSDLTEELFTDREEAMVDRGSFDAEGFIAELEQDGHELPAAARDRILSHDGEEPQPDGNDYVPYYPVLLGISVPGQGDAALRRARRDVQSLLGSFWLTDTNRSGWISLPPDVLREVEYEIDGRTEWNMPRGAASAWATERIPYLSFARGTYRSDHIERFAAPLLLDDVLTGAAGELSGHVAEAVGTRAAGASALARRLAAACRYAHVAATTQDPADALAMAVVGMEALVVRSKRDPAASSFTEQISVLLGQDERRQRQLKKMYEGRSSEFHAGDATLNIDALSELARLSQEFLRDAARRYSDLITSGISDERSYREWLDTA